MLGQWFKTVERERFYSEYYRRQPLAQAGTLTDGNALLDWNRIEQLLLARADLMLVRDGVLRPERNPTEPPELAALFATGYSFVLRHCERHDHDLAALAHRFADEVGGEVAVQVYATPGRFHSFGWHYDYEDVFIAQTAGEKTYYLRRNTINPAPRREAMPRDMQYERETTPLMASTLIAGDCLYIPRGWWHLGRANETSLSLSIGIVCPD